ncbi:MAG: hypothetical protein AAF802_18835 [Planctomycetota bacterium]
MNIAILHCHFLRGGVTQVVENQVASVADDSDTQFFLISGGRNDGLNDQTRQRVGEVVISQLDYDDIHGATADLQCSIQSLAAAIAASLQSRGLGPTDTILHWHNPTLGKNIAIPGAILSLAERHGYRQLLQIHDYAEDHRPENYLRMATGLAASLPDQPLTPTAVAGYCYPDAPSIHYATLTTSDAEILRRLSIDESRIVVIPNCVSLGDASQLPDREESTKKIRQAFGLGSDSRWIVYPVRGIRRKNVGEFLLLSQLLGEPFSLGITLPPTTPIEKESYDRWKSVGNEYARRAIFDAGTKEGIQFLDNLVACEFVLSTSVAEGFGMAFLEPWLVGRGVIARRLPNVVDDFVAAGVRLDRFYRSIMIPGSVEWINAQRRDYSDCLASAWSSLDAALGSDFCVDSGAVLGSDGGRCDFGKLSPKSQIDVIRRCGSDDGFLQEIRSLNANLLGAFQEPFDGTDIVSNQAKIRETYSLAATAEILRHCYTKILASDTTMPKQRIQPDSSPLPVLQRSRDFYPCRTEQTIAKCILG